MKGPADRLTRFMPNVGLFATRAGKRVALAIGALMAGSALAAAVLFAVIVGVWDVEGGLRTTTVHALLFGILGALATLAIAFVLLPLVGRFSGLANDFALLELSNPGSPLLRELMASAPGTYSHSIMTGSLAERAASEIGANGLLARVGAYYHDIGKSVRPDFFVENQAGSGNPHDKASPSQSAFIIIAHVREGVEIARKHHLPQAVIDIIRQHHGTSLVRVFYAKARRDGADVSEDDFRYEGELPTSRESALVMLADVAEAAARAVHDPSDLRLRSTVRKVVDARVADGQLRDSQMSGSDIDRTVEAYATMLASVYHARVEYPEDVQTRRPRDAGTSRQPSRS